MITSFYMPTRIVSGWGALDGIGRLARELGMSRVLVVSDAVISRQGFHADALARLAQEGIEASRFDECGIDEIADFHQPGNRVDRMTGLAPDLRAGRGGQHRLHVDAAGTGFEVKRLRQGQHETLGGRIDPRHGFGRNGEN